MDEIKKQICEIGSKLYEREMVSSSEGSLSVRAEEGIYITPRKMSKGFLKEHDISLLDFDGNVIYSLLEPSVRTNLHVKIYKHQKDVNAVICAHPIIANEVAHIAADITSFYIPDAEVFHADLPPPPFSDEQLQTIIDTYVNRSTGIITSTNGALAWSMTLQKCYNMMEQLEYYSRKIIAIEMGIDE